MKGLFVSPVIVTRGTVVQEYTLNQE